MVFWTSVLPVYDFMIWLTGGSRFGESCTFTYLKGLIGF